MSTFLNLVTNSYKLLSEEESQEVSHGSDLNPDVLPVSDKETSSLPKEKLDSTVKIQLVKLAVQALFVDKDRLEETNSTARTIINKIAEKSPIDVTNVEETQKLLEELLSLVEIPA